MFKAANIVDILLETEDDFDPEEIVSGAPREPTPRVAVRRVWSLWITPLRPEFQGYRDAERPDVYYGKPEWRKNAWIDEIGAPIQPTPRQQSKNYDNVLLTLRFLNRRRAMPVDSTTYRTYNLFKEQPYDGESAKTTVITHYFYLIDFTKEQLGYIHNHLWDWRQALETWPDNWSPDYNPLPA